MDTGTPEDPAPHEIADPEQAIGKFHLGRPLGTSRGRRPSQTSDQAGDDTTTAPLVASRPRRLPLCVGRVMRRGRHGAATRFDGMSTKRAGHQVFCDRRQL